MATQVTMEDGTESPLVDHVRDAHQKGTRGYTEEYLDTMHRALHKRKREPEEELEHRHPDAAGGGDGVGSQDHRSSAAMEFTLRGREAPFTQEATNGKHRDSEEQEMSGTMKSKHRDRDGQRDGRDTNGKHRDRDGQRHGQDTNGKHRARDGQDTNGKHRDRYAQGAQEVPGQRTGQQDQGMPEDVNNDNHEHEDQLVSAGGRQRGGKHRKQRH